jgi:hypothetical protein
MFNDRNLFLSFALEGSNQNNIIILQWRPKRFQFLLKVGVLACLQHPQFKMFVTF